MYNIKKPDYFNDTTDILNNYIQARARYESARRVLFFIAILAASITGFWAGGLN